MSSSRIAGSACGQGTGQGRHNKHKVLSLCLFSLSLCLCLSLGSCSPEAPYQRHRGPIFGTYYSVVYQHPRDLHAGLRERMWEVDRALSLFNPQSTLSRFNADTASTFPLFADSLAYRVIAAGMEVSALTQGHFDMTVGPLVNYWGFGKDRASLPDAAQIDSLRAYVGWEKLRLDPQGKLHRSVPGLQLDGGAIAKGFACDHVAAYLRAQGVEHYMVCIGGEIVLRGLNPQGEPWRIGIQTPVSPGQSQATEADMPLQALASLTHTSQGDRALATSGDYLNFREINGQKYGHSLNPHTGWPARQNILSASVLAPTCLLADAYATAFMVMGLEAARAFLAAHPELNLEAYFICAAPDGTYATWQSPGFPPLQAAQ